MIDTPVVVNTFSKPTAAAEHVRMFIPITSHNAAFSRMRVENCELAYYIELPCDENLTCQC
jgi:hypothetical protein